MKHGATKLRDGPENRAGLGAAAMPPCRITGAAKGAAKRGMGMFEGGKDACRSARWRRRLQQRATRKAHAQAFRRWREALRTTRKPWLALECRRGTTQSQQYLMSYIRHMYSREKPGREIGVCDEMRP